jgi:hypothetical protein
VEIASINLLSSRASELIYFNTLPSSRLLSLGLLLILAPLLAALAFFAALAISSSTTRLEVPFKGKILSLYAGQVSKFFVR